MKFLMCVGMLCMCVCNVCARPCGSFVFVCLRGCQYVRCVCRFVWCAMCVSVICYVLVL